MPKRPKHDNFVVEFGFKQLESQNWTITYDSRSDNFLLKCPWGHIESVPQGLGKGAGDIFGAARSRHPKQKH
jgi:hypothetical protein